MKPAAPIWSGAVALAAAIRQLQAVGMDQVAAHEAELTAYALPRLKAVPGLAYVWRYRPGTACQAPGRDPALAGRHSALPAFGDPFV